MGTKLDTLHMTPAELAVNARIEADIAAGVDPFDEEDENPQDTDIPTDETTPVNTTADATATPPVDATASPAPAEPPAAAPAPAASTETPPADPPVAAEPPAAAAPADLGVAPDLSDLKGLVLPAIPEVDAAAAEAKVAELQSKLDEVNAKFEDGTLTPAERNAQARPLEAQIRETDRNLAVQLGRQAAAIDLANTTSEQVLGRLRAAGARDGLDYGQPGAATTTAHARQFDLVSQALRADPKNAGKSWVEMAALADAQVRVMNGIAPKVATSAPAPAAASSTPAAKAPAAPAPKPAATRAAPPAPPQTLRELPAAARSLEASETIAGKLAAANAHGRDAMWNKMTQAQRSALLGED